MRLATDQPPVDETRPTEVHSDPGWCLDGLAVPAGRLDFGRWAEALRPRLVRLAYRYLWHAHDAEEIAQEAIAVAWQQIIQQVKLKNRNAWLYRVVVNLCMNRLRRHQAGPLPPGDAPGAFAPNELPVETDELAQRARVVIRELPPRLQAALVLRDIEELDYGQIAVILEIRRTAARLLVHRARETVRKTLLSRWPESFR